MILTPLHLQIFLHYFVSQEEWPMLHSPTHGEYAEKLVREGLLEHRWHEPGASYRATEMGRAHVEALTRVPFPVCKWITPAIEEQTNA